jgi:modulator of drug activity B
MSNILIINGAKRFNFAKGELNELYVNTACEVLSQLGHNVSVTKADSDFDPQDEISKILNSDVLIYQMPGWWMGEPWTVKNGSMKYSPKGMAYCMKVMDVRALMDQKNMARVVFFRDKIHAVPDMECPLEAFNDPEQFFEGFGVDGLYLHFHKANQFLGMAALPTFITNDVVKSPDVENEICRFSDHLIATYS